MEPEKGGSTGQSNRHGDAVVPMSMLHYHEEKLMDNINIYFYVHRYLHEKKNIADHIN